MRRVLFRTFCIKAFSRKASRGFSLVEVTIAIAVLTAAVIGITSLTNYSLRLARVARQQLIAANLAQEGMEIVHALRDTNWIATKLADSACATCPCTASWREGLCNSSVRSYEFDYATTRVCQVVNLPLCPVSNAFSDPGTLLNISSA